MRVLGLDLSHPGAGAALLVDGELVAEAFESRLRGGAKRGLPAQAVREVCRQAKIDLSLVDHVAVAGKPFVSLERWWFAQLAAAPRGFATFRRELATMRGWLYPKEALARELRRVAGGGAWERRLLFAERHRCYAEAAYRERSYADSALLVFGGSDEWAAVSIAAGRRGTVEMLEELRYPHSPDRFLDGAAVFFGLKDSSKLMPLAAGEAPEQISFLKERLVEPLADGSLRLPLECFGSALPADRRRKNMVRRLGSLPAEPAVLAASWLRLTEEWLAAIGRRAAKLTGMKSLAITAGATVGALASDAITRDRSFNRVTLSTSTGAAGGAALAAQFGFLGWSRTAMRAARKRR